VLWHRPFPRPSERTFPAVALALVAALACGATGCGPGTPGPPSEPQGGTAVFATLSDLDTVNELLGAGTNFSSDILQRVFLPLLREQPDYQDHPPTFRPALATGWEFSPDRHTLTFFLRPEASWSDGAPVTAEDVRWSWQAQRDPDVAWGYAQVKEHVTDVEVVDPHTVRFHFDRVYASQLIDANEGLILPKHLWSQLPFERWREEEDWFRDHMVASGPFVLERWSPQEEIVLSRNERYFDPQLPRLDRAVFRVVPDQDAQLNQLLAGDLDLVSGVSPDDADQVDAAEGVRLLTYWNRAYSYLCWNTARPLFAEPEVRRALTMAIDRRGLIEALWHGYAGPSVSPIISTVWAHDRELEPWPYDPGAAREILARHGWKDSDGDGVLDRDGQRFSFELTTNAGNTLRADALVLIQEQLARVGIEARPRFLEMNTLVSANLAHDFDATLGAWGIDTTLDLSYAFHSASIEGGYNYGAYSNPEVDRLLDTIAEVETPDAAGPLFLEVQRILHQDQPYTFLWEPMRIVGIRDRLRDARSNPLYTYFALEEWWLAP